MTLAAPNTTRREARLRSAPPSATRPRLLISEATDFSALALAELNEIAEVTSADLDRPGLVQAVSDAEILWVRLRHRIDAEVMQAAPRLRIIVTPTTGLNHIDVAAAEARRIRVVSLRGEDTFLKNVRATAEHTIGLMLSLLRHVPAAASHVSAGGWNRDLFKGAELHRKTVGIVGYGRLGRIITRYLQAFDARVLATDPKYPNQESMDGVSLVALDTLLKQSELVSLHVNLCPDNAGFFGEKQFAMMRPNAWFINTARGELVDEVALLEALQRGRLNGAAVDVLADEQSSGMLAHPLVAYAAAHENLIITPHIGGCTRESMEETELFLAHKLADVLRNRVEDKDDLLPSLESHDEI